VLPVRLIALDGAGDRNPAGRIWKRCPTGDGEDKRLRGEAAEAAGIPNRAAMRTMQHMSGCTAMAEVSNRPTAGGSRRYKSMD
jgi:hypothetical protein